MLDSKVRSSPPTTLTTRLAEQCGRLRCTQGNRFTAQLAGSQDLRHAVYQLRYDTYLSCGHIADAGDGRLRDEFDNDEFSKTVVIFKGDTVVASARACFLDMAMVDTHGCSLPSAKVFPSEVETAVAGVQRRDRPSRAIEITKLVRSVSCEKHRGLTIMIFKLLSYLVIDFDADLIFASVCAHHVKFYQRIGFERVGVPRLWPGLQGVKVQLLVCRRDVHRKIQDNLPRLVAARPGDSLYRRFRLGDRVSIFPDLVSRNS